MFPALFTFGKKRKEKKKKECTILIRVQTSCPVLASSSTCQYHPWETLLSRLVGSRPAPPPPPPKIRGKRGFISTHAATLFCWEHCISLIMVLSVKWMCRNSWHNIMWQIQFGIDWQCEIHCDRVTASRTVRARRGIICIGERRAFAGSNLLGSSDFGNLIAGTVERGQQWDNWSIKVCEGTHKQQERPSWQTLGHTRKTDWTTRQQHTLQKKKKRVHLLLTSWFFDPLMTCNIHTPSYWMFHYNCRDAAECIMEKHGADYLQNVYHLSCAVGFSVFLLWNVWPSVLLLCIPVRWKIKGNTITLTSCA